MRQKLVSYANQLQSFPGRWGIDGRDGCDSVAIIESSIPRHTVLKCVVQITVTVGKVG